MGTMSALVGGMVEVGAQPMGETHSLQKFKLHARLVKARITVIRRFKSGECTVSSSSTVGSPQSILRKLEKSCPSESSGDTNHSAAAAGALGSVKVIGFSTSSGCAKDEPKHRGQRMEQGKRELRPFTRLDVEASYGGANKLLFVLRLFFKACKAIKESPLRSAYCWRILLLMIIFQILKEYPPEDSRITELVVVIVAELAFTPDSVGTCMLWAPTDLTKGLSKNIVNNQAILLLSLGLLMPGVCAEDQTQSRLYECRKPEAVDTLEAPLLIKAALAILLVLMTVGGAGVARRMYNRWRPRRGDWEVDQAIEHSPWNKSNKDFTIWAEC